MIISLRADGTAVMLEPSHVYQGSNVADVFVIAPFPNTTVLQVGFTLPDGTSTSAPMTYVQDSENNLVIWQYTIAAAITNVAGAASVSVTATTTTGQIIATQSIPFTIEATTLPVLPDTPSQDEWTLVLQYIQQNSANIATIQGQISTIEETANTANENAATALTTAQSAETTANQAASEVGQYTQQIAEANANASEALDKATQAEQTVGTFETALNEANTNASNAVSTANAAQQTANQAASEVGQYTQQIETANSNASAAVATANGAATTAQQAESTAQSAQTGVNNLVNGTTSAGNANQLGGVAASSYAQLSQVVRTDTAQSLNSTQQLQAQNNIYPSVTDLNSVPLPFGICSQVFTFNVNTANAPTTDGGMLIQSIYENVYNGGYYTQTVFMNTEGGGEIYTRRHDGANGWTNWQRYMSIDPTTLTPSTANGWTEGNPASILPSKGLYWVAAVATSPSETLNAWRTLLSYDGSQGDCLMPTNQPFTLKCEATTSGFTFTESTSGSSITMTTVWYKQIL